MSYRKTNIIAFSLVLCLIATIGLVIAETIGFSDTYTSSSVVPVTPDLNGIYPGKYIGKIQFSEVISDAPGMDAERWHNQDVKWEHYVLRSYVSNVSKVSAVLTIRAYGVNRTEGEIDNVYADGVLLGNLTGKGDQWSYTKFRVPVGLLKDGVLDVHVDVDANYGTGVVPHHVKIDSSKLEVSGIIPHASETFEPSPVVTVTPTPTPTPTVIPTLAPI
ncbi:MAG: hypothetical protein ACE5J9_03115 [Methanosarcinales archaeon]